jgi:putative phosphoesterase
MSKGKNMNLLVFSDSHGRGSNMLDALARQIKRPDAIIFLGDGLKDLWYCDFGDIPIFAVSGNCDIYNFYGKGIADKELVVTFGGKRFMLVHGDRYGVKQGFARIVMAADEKEVDVVLFGHTHTPLSLYIDKDDNELGLNLKKPLYLFNPGSIGDYNASFGCVTLDERGGILLSHGSI